MYHLEKYKSSYFKIDSFYKILAWEIISILFFRSAISFLNYSTKSWILRRFGALIGKNVIIKRSLHIKCPWNLEIADNVWIGERVWIDNISKVSIGSNVCISQGVSMTSGNHNYKKECFDLLDSPIKIGSNVWIGAFSVILPGSNIKSNIMIIAGGIFPKNYQSKLIK